MPAAFHDAMVTPIPKCSKDFVLNGEIAFTSCLLVWWCLDDCLIWTEGQRFMLV